MVSEAEAATAIGIQTATSTWTGGSTDWFGVIVPVIGAGADPVMPTVSSVSPNSGPIGTAVTITGTNFGAAQGAVSFNGTAALVTRWSASGILVAVPTGATSGNIVVTAGGVQTKDVNFTVLPSALPTARQVVTAIENVNNYWIANNAPGNADWTEATYFTGDLAAYDATGQSNYLTFAQTWATNNSYNLSGSAWGEGPGGNTTNHPNYQAAGQVYIRLYQLSNQSSDLSGIAASVHGMVNSTIDNEWTWIDAINMSAPNFAELGSIDYAMYALYYHTKYTLGLYDSTTGLWWENSTYVNTSTYWSRGNGWVFAALAKILSVLPKSDPHYQEYFSTFTTMARALAARQQPGGYWSSDLGGTDYAGPESSGTSFFLYGFAWGLNNGILDQNTYLPVVQNAWNFLANTAIQTSPPGLLGYVQPPDGAPGPTTATTTEDFGVGAFLLAARQMQLLVQ
jgi:rhamnogalacturonyl hydrolase YesR